MKKLTPRELMIYSLLHRSLVVKLGLTLCTSGFSQKQTNKQCMYCLIQDCTHLVNTHSIAWNLWRTKQNAIKVISGLTIRRKWR